MLGLGQLVGVVKEIGPLFARGNARLLGQIAFIVVYKVPDPVALKPVAGPDRVTCPLRIAVWIPIVRVGAIAGKLIRLIVVGNDPGSRSTSVSSRIYSLPEPWVSPKIEAPKELHVPIPKPNVTSRLRAIAKRD